MTRTPAPVRTCLACFQPKPADMFRSRQARKCETCRTAPDPPRDRECCRCHEQQPAAMFVRGGRLCAACRQEPVPSAAARDSRACLRCFEVKPAMGFDWGPGEGKGTYRRRRGVCSACVAAEREAKAARRVASRASWERDDGVLVRRCSKCRDVKPLKKEFYVNDPRANGLRHWRACCKSCDNQRVKAYRERLPQTPAGRAKAARWKRQWVKRNPAAAKAARARYRAKIKADPQRHAASLEDARIGYRLRQERAGRSLDDIPAIRAVMPRESRRLEAAPLARAVDGYARRLGLTVEEASARAGVPPRNLFAWRTGERELVRVDVADRVLLGLGLQWWDVWEREEQAA